MLKTLDPSTSILAVDLEAWELDASKILEVGIAWIQSTDDWATHTTEAIHIIIKDNLDLNNGRWVVDNRENFRFGASELMSVADAHERIHIALGDATRRGNVFLFGHSIEYDIRWLESLGIYLGHWDICDIADVDRARRLDVNRRKLGVIAGEYSIACIAPHNAGNDAVYTAESGLAMLAEENVVNLMMRESERYYD
jgi:hypothetical protein